MRNVVLVIALMGGLAACSNPGTPGADGQGGAGACTTADCNRVSPTDCDGAVPCDGIVDTNGPCDASSSSPTTCDDGDVCTRDQSTGSAADCNADCVHTAILACTPGDGCCPAGCSEASDADCSGGSVVPDCDAASVPASPSSLSVNVSGPVQTIPGEIFGVLMEILGKDINGGLYVGTGSAIPNTDGIRNDLIEGFKEAGVGAIQWPGGCAANGYDWQSNVNPSNTMGTDLFMEFCDWVGAAPFLVGRPKASDAQSNRDWIEYVNDNPNHPDWNLKYFKVGNEVWGCGGNLGDDEATYETWYNANHDLLQTPVNGKDPFLVAATGGIWTVNSNTSNWLTTMLSPGHLADKIDGIEIHDYVYFPDTVPCVGFSEDQYYDIVDRANEGQIAPRIRDIKKILDQYDPAGRIKIIEDEWGDWLEEFDASDTWFQQGTLMDAISAAEQLHVFMEHADRIQMAGLAQPINVIHSLFLTNSASGGSDLVKTPTFYVFKMFVPHHRANARWAPTSLSSEDITGNGKTFPVLSAGATVDDEGRVHVSLVNVDLDNPRSVTVTLDSSAVGYAVASAGVITGAEKDSYNDFGKPEAVNIQPLPETSYTICGNKLQVTLPTKSIAMLSLEPL